MRSGLRGVFLFITVCAAGLATFGCRNDPHPGGDRPVIKTPMTSMTPDHIPPPRAPEN